MEALGWLAKAADEGHPYAMEMFEKISGEE